jgi:hypothetical protein
LVRGESGAQSTILLYNKWIEGPRREKKPFSVHERKFPFQFEVGVIWAN